MGSTKRVTVTNGKWSVGTCSGSGIDGVRFEPFRVLLTKSFPKGQRQVHQRTAERTVAGKYLKPACYGKLFPTKEAATEYSLQHGFSQVYYGRPSAFITLRLSPATRRYLKSITDYTARWDTLEKVLSKTLSVDGGRYFQGIRCAPYAAKTRAEWNLYLDGDFERLRQVRNGKLAHNAVKKILGADFKQPTPMPSEEDSCEICGAATSNECAVSHPHI